MNSKKPKIALALSGLIRNSYFCFPYIYDSFLNQGYDVDVFIHTWNSSPVINLYRAKRFEIENQEELLKSLIPQLAIDNTIKIEGNVFHNVAMYYSIKKCFDLIPQEEYDIVIRCRFDLMLQEKINLSKIVEGILEDKYDIFIPGRIFNIGHLGYNDQLAVGSYSAMKYYSDCIFHLNEIVHTIKRWHPESFLKEWLNKSDLRIEQDDYLYRIVRDVTPALSWPEEPFEFKNL
jgi:hypothetical protein